MATAPCGCLCGGSGTAEVVAEDAECRTGLGGSGGGTLLGGSGGAAADIGPGDAWAGRMTGTLIGSESGGELAEAADEERTGVEGPDIGEFRPMGEVSGESLAVPASWSELPTLPTRKPPTPTPSRMVCLLGVRSRGRGCGWFLPGRFLGLMPGERRLRPFHLILPSCRKT